MRFEFLLGGDWRAVQIGGGSPHPSLVAASPQSPNFKREREKADWLQSPAGRRHSERTYAKAKREGKLVKGLTNVTPTDPALLQELVGRAKAKRTEAVSLRIPVSDIEAAKKIGTQTGLGYQTVLKEIISRGLR
jgi:predicted DNA binding CopG/RHH family protein